MAGRDDGAIALSQFAITAACHQLTGGKSSSFRRSIGSSMLAIILTSPPYSLQVSISMISISDGGEYKYSMWLAKEWRKNLEFAQSKGWIKGYKVLANVHCRSDEYLIAAGAYIPPVGTKHLIANCVFRSDDRKLQSKQSGA